MIPSTLHTDVQGFIVLRYPDGSHSSNELHIVIDGDGLHYGINDTCLPIPDEVATRWVELFLAALANGGWETATPGGGTRTGSCLAAPDRPETFAESPGPSGSREAALAT